jgi:uncharacterized membrane protein YbhN (UPF0104 family)
MVRSFLVADSNGVGEILFLFIISFVLCGLISLFFIMVFNNGSAMLNIFLVVILVIFLILLMLRNIFSIRKVVIEFENKILVIQGVSKKIFDRKYSFNMIKSIDFIEKWKQVPDFGEFWQKAIRITSVQNVILYELKVSRIKNYLLLKRLCSKYFSINEFVDKND